MGSLSEQVGATLKTFREDRGVTQIAVAARLGVKPSTLADFESGRDNPTLERLESYAAAYGVLLEVVAFSDDQPREAAHA